MNSAGKLPHAPHPDDGAIDALAASWVRRRGAGLGPAERHEFRAWLAADPRHPAAFACANQQADEFDWPLHTGTLDDVLAGLEDRARRRRRRQRVITTAIAATVALAGGLFWLAPTSLFRLATAANQASPSRLLVVQPQRQTLPDGSVVELNDGTLIEPAFSPAARTVFLRQGAAHFQVATNPSLPFVVKVDGVDVRAVGTAFAVEVKKTAVEVLVTEGRVAVGHAATETQAGRAPSDVADPPPAVSATEIAAGHRAIVSLRATAAVPQVQPVTADELAAKLTWRVPRLEFTGTPLSEVVAMLNHHAVGRPNPQRVVVDPELANLRISGALRADKVDALIAMLEADFPVSAEHHADGRITLHRRI